MSSPSFSFDASQMAQLTAAFHRGAEQASIALARWLESEITISVDSVDRCPLAAAIGTLGTEEAICVSLMEMEGTLTGHMLLAFDDSSGLAVSDMLLGRSAGTAQFWGEFEISCLMETMNITGSTYLNGMARSLSASGGSRCELIPSPPTLLRDFAESLLESAFMDQALSGGEAFFAQSRFELAGQPLQWAFLLIPDSQSLKTLSGLLSQP